MYLKSLKLTNFRKFGESNNIVEFVESQEDLKENEEVDIASSTTLIVGKNNSGKTTITKALEKLIKNNKFIANDFNFTYLNRLINEYKNTNFENLPFLQFDLEIGVETKSTDLVTNITPYLDIENFDEEADLINFHILMKCELNESTVFIENVKSIVLKYDSEILFFNKFLELINNSDFSINYYRSDDVLVERNRFKINDLIEIKYISAEKTINDSNLSKTFNKIIKYRYETKGEEKELNELDREINKI